MAHPLPAGNPAEAVPPEVPVGPAAPAPLGAPRCYRELLAIETNSPGRDRLTSYLQGYRFDGGGGVLQPTVLREQTVVLSDRQPMSFLCLTTGANGFPEVVVLHRLMRYMDMPGEEASGFHDRYLGLVGDIRPHQYIRRCVIVRSLLQGEF